MAGARSRFERAAFASVVPGLALPVAAQFAAGHSAEVVAALGVTSMIAGVFLFVLLGSMIVNALLILRVPTSLSERRLDVRTALPLAGLYAVIIGWSVLLWFGEYGPSLGFAVLTMGFSIAVCVGAVLRRARTEQVTALERVKLGRAVRATLFVFVLVALALIAISPVLDIRGELYNVVGVIDGEWQWGLLLLGLPWSYLVQLMVVIVIVPATTSSYMLFEYGAVTPTTIVLAIPVLFNVVVALLLLGNAHFRTRVVNVFFRLGMRNRASSRKPGA